MRSRTPSWLFLFALALPGMVASGDGAIRVNQEHVERELLQIDLTISGPADAIEKLDASDLQLAIAKRKIPVVALDRVCASGAAPGGLPPASYIFYFDQPHLTPQGRERSLEVATELVPRLVRDGNRAMIASAARKLEIFVEWTDDSQKLLDGISRLRDDPGQFDEFAASEEQRISDLQRISADGRESVLSNPKLQASETGGAIVANRCGGDVSVGMSALNDVMNEMLESEESARMDAATARLRMAGNELQKAEEHHTRRALSVFASLLPRLSEADAPKAVLYFADTVRPNPGEHYIALASRGAHVGVGGVIPEFQRVIDLAITYGIRLYTVQAQGLVDESEPNLRGANSTGRRFLDSKRALVAFSRESGGQAFLNGVGADEIGRRIDGDLGCVYIASVDPKGLPRDRRLGLKIKTKIAGLSIRARSSVILSSDESRVRRRLENAPFESNEAAAGEAMRVVVIPTGLSGKRFRGLVQVVLPPMRGDGGAWEVGVTLEPEQGKMRQLSRRVQLSQPGFPLVFESELEFPPGAYVLTAVARQIPDDRVLSRRVEGEWPRRGTGTIFVGPSVVIQAATAAFARHDETRMAGSLARDRDQWVDPDSPVAVLGVVCSASEGWPEGAAVRRHLIGSSVAPFDDFAPDPDTRCAFYRDLVPAGILTSGRFDYQVAVVDAGGNRLASGSTSFTVVSREFLASSER